MTVKLQVDPWDNYVPYPQYLKLLLRANAATSTNIFDFSGNAKSLTNTGSTTGSSVSNRVNPYSIYFGGASCLVTPTSATYDYTPILGIPYTLSFWVYNTNLSGNYAMVGTTVGDTNTTISFEAAISLATTGQLLTQAYSVNNTSAVQIYSSTNLVAGKWNHVAITVDASNLMKQYINGILVGSGTVSAQIQNSTYPLRVGKFDAPTTAYFNGYMDEIAVWNGVAVPISQLYPQFKPFSFRRA